MYYSSLNRRKPMETPFTESSFPTSARILFFLTSASLWRSTSPAWSETAHPRPPRASAASGAAAPAHPRSASARAPCPRSPAAQWCWWRRHPTSTGSCRPTTWKKRGIWDGDGKTHGKTDHLCLEFKNVGNNSYFGGAKRSENKNDLVGMLVISRWGMGDVDPHTLGSQTCIPLLGESAKKNTQKLGWSKMI